MVKIVVLSEGKIQQIGTPEDIYNESKNAFVVFIKQTIDETVNKSESETKNQ